jgi:hypothetical protein
MVRRTLFGCAAFRLPRIAIPSTLKRARPHGPYGFFYQIAVWPPRLPDAHRLQVLAKSRSKNILIMT